MNPSEYMRAVMVTESKDFESILARLGPSAKLPALRVLHSACGICNEAGELMEIVKKYVFYGKDVDRTHMLEELGDLLWYISLSLDALGFTFEDVMEKNIAKLKARYKDGEFDALLAVERDRVKEREALGG
jgi:NTP pyrophosphatase (non-canonical NTP hydrolase)